MDEQWKASKLFQSVAEILFPAHYHNTLLDPNGQIAASFQRLHDKGYLVDPAQGVEVDYDAETCTLHFADGEAFIGTCDQEKGLGLSKSGRYVMSAYAIPVHEADGEEGEGDE